MLREVAKSSKLRDYPYKISNRGNKWPMRVILEIFQREVSKEW